MSRGRQAARGHGGPETLNARVVAVVEAAKRELLTAVPSPRGVPGRPIADALIAFEERLRQAGDLISATNVERETGNRFATAISEALRRAERLRLEAPILDYEGLVAVLADLLDPLDVFAEEPGGS